MRYRRFGRLGWTVSEIGYGTWGIGGGTQGWQGSSDEQALESLDLAVRLGLNFFDTAWIYGRGNSELLLGQLLRIHRKERLFIASKPPPKNLQWPAQKHARISDVYPVDHIEAYLEKSLTNLGLDALDLFQFHVWQDHWAKEQDWQKLVMRLKDQHLIKGVGISVNTWEPQNVIETLKTGLIDSVQTVYNIFEQRPEDELFPFCLENDIAIIARVPFDEGSLTGNIDLTTTFPENDWRASYFVKENLESCIPRVESLKRLVPKEKSMAQMALSFVLANNAVATVIPGMRTIGHVRSNLSLCSEIPIDQATYDNLKEHRWDREPTWWSQ